MVSLRQMGPVVKIGQGDLGGKARVLPFVQRILDRSKIQEQFAPHTIAVPETWVLATDCFSRFVSQNGLEQCTEWGDDNEIRNRFLQGKLSDGILEALDQYLESHTLPLAVRSSALNEDTHHNATAGLFSTYFIPNRGPERRRQLEEAIKLVFASSFFPDVNRFLRRHSIPREEGQMAVAIESVVGRERGNVFYPLVAGVAQSVNFFPVGEMKAEDGVATIVMGLGSRAVSGMDGIRFCPSCPMVRPSFQQAVDIQKTTQRVIDAVNLEATSVYLTGQETDTILRVPISELENQEGFAEIASVYDEESGVFFESLFRQGQRMVTFNRLLRQTNFPLPNALIELLRLLQEGFGSQLEMEFALDVEGSGADKRFHLAVLQARPLPALAKETRVQIPELPEDRLVIKTDCALGHGAVDHLRHIVFVDPADFSLDTSVAIANEVAELNETLREQSHRYLLLGPGRWGSCNRAVGIPVDFRQIDQARLVAEIATKRLTVEPSQGTHFFHNMVTRDLFYLTVDERLGHQMHLDWFREQPNAAETRFAKLVVAPQNLSVRVDAHRRVGIVYFEKPPFAKGEARVE